MRKQVEIQTVPQLPYDALTSFRQSLDEEKSIYSVCIPPKTVVEDLPRHKVLHIIFSVVFDKADGPPAIMDSVYEVAIAQEIIPSFSENKKVINSGSLEEILFIDARKT